MLLKQIINTTTTNITKQTHGITIKTIIIKPPKHHQMKKTHQHKHTHAPKRQKNIMKRKRITTQTNNKPPYYNNNYYNKKALLKCGDIESNLGPRYTPLLNHPHVHHEKQQTYFYNKTTQIKPEYNHIFKLFEPYLKHTQTTNINQHLIQFCINNSHCPKNYLFYAILIAPTLIQSNSLIAENSTQWTTKLIKSLIESPKPLLADPHILQKFHLENPHIIKPLDDIQKEIYSFITTEHPDLAILQHKFPYLPEKMAIETLKCLQPIPNFTQPNPIQNHLAINPQNTPHTNLATQMLSWNCRTLNTALRGLQSLTNKPNAPSIIAIQETKLTASKSTKYLQRLFPQYKMILNNTTATTQTRRIQGQPYNNPRGGLLILLHQQRTFLGNITKITTTANISPYIQIIKLTNHPLSTYFLIHLYMPTHNDDINLIPTIQTTIFNHIHNNPLSNIIMLGDFNRDIALIGKQHGTTNSAPTQQDLDWKQFTNSLHLQYIPTDTNYSYQGGYTSRKWEFYDCVCSRTGHLRLLQYF
jgi:exonuclease III